MSLLVVLYPCCTFNASLLSALTTMSVPTLQDDLTTLIPLLKTTTPVLKRVTSLLLKATTSLLFVIVVVTLAISVYRLYLHPLAGVPGPRLAALSNIWHAYHARNGRMYLLGKSLHKRYGPVVRVGPNELWFDSKEAFKTIYSRCLFGNFRQCMRFALGCDRHHANGIQ